MTLLASILGRLEPERRRPRSRSDEFAAHPALPPDIVFDQRGEASSSGAESWLLHDAAHGVRASAKGSRLLQELCAHLRARATKADREADRVFLNDLRSSLLADGIELRLMPQAMTALARVLESTDVNLEAIAERLQLEPSLATRMVGLANGAFGGKLQLSSLPEALSRLGLRETKTALLALTNTAKLFRYRDDPRESQRIHRHAVASAVAAKHLAEYTRKTEPEAAFLAGLLSELGRLVILSSAAEPRPRNPPSESFVQTTAEELHAAVSAVVAESWRFSPEIIAAVRFHHRPTAAPAPAQNLALHLFVADELASSMLEPNTSAVRDFAHLAARESLGLTEGFETMKSLVKDDFEARMRWIVPSGQQK